MSIVYRNYIPLLTIVFVIFSFLILFFEIRYFKWVKKYWFFNRKKRSFISSFLYLAGFLLLIISILDIRGPLEKTDVKIPDQRTIILIDVSLSMLTEDIIPNRISRAVFLAKHFVKQSIGHRISVIVFSNSHKRLIPFTDDIDLIDARLSAILELKVVKGGSNIRGALLESMKYFDQDLKIGSANKNIVVLSDSENHIEIGGSSVEDVNIAWVGIGTIKGGNIPIRYKDGQLKSYKKKDGKLVVSKLNETFIKKMESESDTFKYWIPLQNGIFTDEILKFFSDRYVEKLFKSKVNFRPILAKYFAIPGIICLVFSFILQFGSVFSVKKITIALAILLTFSLNDLNANLLTSSEIGKMMKSGDLTRSQRLKYSEILAKEKKIKQAKKLYEENIRPSIDSIMVLINYATVLLENKLYKRGFDLIENLLSRTEVSSNKNIREVLNNNALFALDQMLSNKKKSGKKEEKENKQKDKKDKKEKQKKNQNKKQGKEKQNKNNQQKQNTKQKNADMKKNNTEVSQSPRSLKEKEDKLRKQKKMIKMKGILKQLLNDDRQIQKKVIDTHTGGKSKQGKDW